MLQSKTGWVALVIRADSHSGGFSPGVAATLYTANKRTVFLKAVGSEMNPRTPDLHRREARIMQALPLADFTPQLLWFLDDLDSGWVVLIFEHIDGHHPAEPWQEEELQRIMQTLIALSTNLNTSLFPDDAGADASTRFAKGVNGWDKIRSSEFAESPQLDPWLRQHLAELCELEARAPDAVAGDAVLHFDLRADNILLTGDRTWILDWAGAAQGVDWLDVVLFAPSVAMQGGPDPDALLQHHPSCRSTDPDDITAAVASLSGFFTYRAL